MLIGNTFLSAYNTDDKMKNDEENKNVSSFLLIENEYQEWNDTAEGKVKRHVIFLTLQMFTFAQSSIPNLNAGWMLRYKLRLTCYSKK
jgi:hypothetical protein